MKSIVSILVAYLIFILNGIGQPAEPLSKADSVFNGVIHEIDWNTAIDWENRYIAGNEGKDTVYHIAQKFYFPTKVFQKLLINAYAEDVSILRNNDGSDFSLMGYYKNFLIQIDSIIDSNQDSFVVEEDRKREIIIEAAKSIAVLQFSLGIAPIREYMQEEVRVYNRRREKEEKVLEKVDPSIIDSFFEKLFRKGESEIAEKYRKNISDFDKPEESEIKAFIDSLVGGEMNDDHKRMVAKFMYNLIRKDIRLNREMIVGQKVNTLIIFPLNENFEYVEFVPGVPADLRLRALEHPILCPPLCDP